MRIHHLIAIVLIALTSATVSAQTETKGKRTEVDSAGKAKTTTYEEVSTSQDITPRNNMIVINPLKFLVYYNLSYYRRISDHTVLGAGLQIPFSSAFGGFGANAEVRFHPSGKAMRGFYVAPNVSYTNLTTTIFSSSVSGGDATIGILLGWQWFPGDEFAMGLGIGVDRYFYLGSANSSAFSNYIGTLPALRFDIGYAWE